MFEPVSDAANNAIGKVSHFADAFFVIVITFLGLMAWRRGEKEGKSKPDDVSMPTYLMAHDAAKSIDIIADASQDMIALQEKTNAVLADIAKSTARIDLGQVHTHRLINALRNERELRDTMAHPERDGNGEAIE